MEGDCSVRTFGSYRTATDSYGDHTHQMRVNVETDRREPNSYSTFVFGDKSDNYAEVLGCQWGETDCQKWVMEDDIQALYARTNRNTESK